MLMLVPPKKLLRLSNPQNCPEACIGNTLPDRHYGVPHVSGTAAEHSRKTSLRLSRDLRGERSDLSVESADGRRARGVRSRRSRELTRNGRDLSFESSDRRGISLFLILAS